MEFFDFKKKSTNGLNRFMTVIATAGKYQVYLNKEIAREVNDKGVSGVRIAGNNLTGEWFIVFTNEAPLLASVTEGHVKIYSRDLCKFLIERVGMTSGKAVELSANRSDFEKTKCLTYKIRL